MQLEMTEFELFSEVQKNYKGFLDIPKALKLFDMENGYTPTIIVENDDEFENGLVTQDVIDKINTINGNDFCTVKAMVFMRKLQESGRCNMIVGDVRNIIQTTLIVDREEAATIHKAYMKHYTELYNPESIV